MGTEFERGMSMTFLWCLALGAAILAGVILHEWSKDAKETSEMLKGQQKVISRAIDEIERLNAIIAEREKDENSD